jgi:hypothetical protein
MLVRLLEPHVAACNAAAVVIAAAVDTDLNYLRAAVSGAQTEPSAPVKYSSKSPCTSCPYARTAASCT